MNDTEIERIAVATAQAIEKIPRTRDFGPPDIFEKSFGFFQFATKNNLSILQRETFMSYYRNEWSRTH